MDTTYNKTLDAIVISWLEVRDGKPTFQKRVYKETKRAQEYLNRLVETRGLNVSNVQVKVCYKINYEKEAQL